MPPTNKPPRRQPPRRKSKPKFEIPAEAGLPPAAGWVYRAAEVPSRDPSAKVPAKLIPTKPVQVKHVPTKPRAAVQEPVTLAAVSPAPQETEPLWTAGFDLVALGFTTMQKTASGTFHILSAPIRTARRLLI